MNRRPARKPRKPRPTRTPSIDRLFRVRDALGMYAESLTMVHAVYFEMAHAGDVRRRALGPIVEAVTPSTIEAVLTSIDTHITRTSFRVPARKTEDA